MAGTGIRTTISGIGGRDISHTPGDPTGLQINTFVLDKMIDGLNGEALKPIVVDAMEPAYNQAKAEWPIYEGPDHVGGASNDSIKIWVPEVEETRVRVALSAGGIALIEDERNRQHKDYAPHIEFNGTKTAAPGTLTRAVTDNTPESREIIRAGALALLKRLAR